MLLIIAPLLLNLDFVLGLWLTETPKFVSIFITLSLVGLLIDSISEPLVIANQATGAIKWFQVVEGSLIILNVPLSYVLLQVNHNPTVVFYVAIGINLVALAARLFLVKNIINCFKFLKIILSRIVVICILVFTIAFLIQNFFSVSIGFICFSVQTLILCFSIVVLIYLVGLERNEKSFLKNFIALKWMQIKSLMVNFTFKKFC